ncbi:MAG: enoyl-CoA hydratase/isomerase family protein [Pseudobdellovibrionaceae bacterium]
MTNKYKFINLEEIKPTVWCLTIQRPEAMNALNKNVFADLQLALQEISSWDFSKLRVLIITGSGEKSFVAGADIKELSVLNNEQALQLSQSGQKVFQQLALLKVPVIAAVNGFALGGGCELALACDFIYAAENAKFGLPEVSLGLIPGYAGTVRLPKAVGQRRANEMIFTGQLLTAAEALQFGLVNKVIPNADLLNEVIKTADAILAKSPLAVSKAKLSILEAQTLDLPAGQKNEAHIFSELFQSADMLEGTQAFLEKRKAHFTGQ